MAQAEHHEVLAVEKDKLLNTITHYEDYPKFVEGCTSVKIEHPSSEVTRVTYHVNMMSQDIVYTLDHKVDRASGNVEWTLIDSNFFKKNNGHWAVKSVGANKSDVIYALDVEFKIPVPGFILNRVVKSQLPAMVRSFEKRANLA
jgi:ribosome-associated toxin RatA of RatAB toxin-antitoxin module